MNCRCDEQLAFTLATLASFADDQFFTNANGLGFIHAAECQSSNKGGNGGENLANSNDGLGVKEVQCCGSYPRRFEFNTHGGSRACCGGKTYNTSKQECCEGDFLGPIGSCDARIQ